MLQALEELIDFELVGFLLIQAEGVEPGHSMELLIEGVGCCSSFLDDPVRNLLLYVVDSLLAVDNLLPGQVERSFEHSLSVYGILHLAFSHGRLLRDDMQVLQVGRDPFLDELVEPPFLHFLSLDQLLDHGGEFREERLARVFLEVLVLPNLRAVELSGRVSVEDGVEEQVGVLELSEVVVGPEEVDHPDHVEGVWQKIEVKAEVLLSQVYLLGRSMSFLQDLEQDGISWGFLHHDLSDSMFLRDCDSSCQYPI